MNFQKLTEYLDNLSTTYGVPGCDVIITKGHETIYRHSAGFSDYEKTRPVGNQDLYMLYSASKVITATAVMQLVERGQLSLYDEVTKFFPSFGHLKVADSFAMGIPMKWPTTEDPCHLAHNSIRIIDLLTMTAGLSYDDCAKELIELRDATDSTASTQDIVAKIGETALVYEPRTHWSYSLGHDVLAGVVEKVTGMSYGDYLKNNIFLPLGAEHITFHPTEEERTHLAALWSGVISAEGQLTDEIKAYPEGYDSHFFITKNYESGGAGLFGVVSEYSKIIEALANYGVGRNGARILKKETVRLLMTPYTTGEMQKDFENAGKVGYSYGLGVRVLTDASKAESNLGEFGWDSAAGAFVLVDPTENISIMYAQHIFGFPKVYSEIHPVVRDLAYQGIRS